MKSEVILSQKNSERHHLLFISMENYVLQERIGEGTFCSVYKALHKPTSCTVAMKRLPKKDIKPRECELLQKRISQLQTFDHPNIAKIFELVEDSDYYYIIMEYVPNGNLLDQINQSCGIGEHIARKVFIQLIKGLDYLHNSKHICHRDLKLENIMLDRCNNIKIIDFGLSKDFNPANPVLTTKCGSPPYLAPELLSESSYTATSDLWSAGIILFSMVSGRLPFFDTNTNNLFRMILLGEPEYPEDISEELTDLLQKLLDKCPDTRINFNGIRNHPWIKGYDEEITIVRGQTSYQSFSYSKSINMLLDHETLMTMEDLGIDTENLVDDIANSRYTYSVICYFIIKSNIITPNHPLRMTMRVNSNVRPVTPKIKKNEKKEKSPLSILKPSFVEQKEGISIPRPINSTKKCVQTTSIRPYVRQRCLGKLRIQHYSASPIAKQAHTETFA